MCFWWKSYGMLLGGSLFLVDKIKGLFVRGDGITTMSPMKGLFPLKRFVSRILQAWNRAEFPVFKSVGKTSSLICPKGNHLSHLIGGVAIGCRSVDNVVFGRNSRLRVPPKVSPVLFCLWNKVIISAWLPEWPGGKRRAWSSHVSFACTKAVICIPFHEMSVWPMAQNKLSLAFLLLKNTKKFCESLYGVTQDLWDCSGYMG